jgi:hypothetical protein
MGRPLLAVAALAFLVAVLAACGNSGTGDGPGDRHDDGDDSNRDGGAGSGGSMVLGPLTAACFGSATPMLRTDADPNITQPAIGGSCRDVLRDGFLLDGDHACSVRLSGGGSDDTMFCHETFGVCVRPCEQAADCPEGWVCDDRPETTVATISAADTNGQPLCVNPCTCEAPANASPQDAGDDASCALERGLFEPLYAPLTGNCGPLNDANYVPVEADTQIQQFANVDVETETAVTGCSVELVQTVRDKAGVPQKRIAGTLQIDLPTKLSGEVTLQRFDSNGTAVCFGTYDAILIKRTTTLGGAAQ